METVDILAVVDRFDECLLGDMARKGKLQDETVDVRILIELSDGFEELFFGHVILVADECRAEAAGFAGFDFIGYIGLAAAVVADKDGCEMGAAFALGHHFFDFSCDFALDVVCCLFSVDKCHLLIPFMLRIIAIGFLMPDTAFIILRASSNCLMSLLTS